MKVMSSKYAGKCKASGLRFDEGAEVLWLGKGNGCVLMSEARKQCDRPLFADMLARMIDEPRSSTQPGAVHEFTVEMSRGETYENRDLWTLYAHSTYGRSSVLAGQNCRSNMRDIGELEDAIVFMQAVPKWMPVSRITGTTHVPVDVVTAHLSDEPDF
jgi:hypothetical protein